MDMNKTMKWTLVLLTALLLALVCCGIAMAEEDTAWVELQAQIDKATGPITIVLDGDVRARSGDGNLYIGKDKDITVDLRGHSIDRARTEPTNYGHVIQVEGRLTVTDSVGGGTITGGNTKNAYTGGVLVRGTFTLENGTICDNRVQMSYGGGVYIDKGTFNMNGGAITGNVASEGSACTMGMATST